MGDEAQRTTDTAQACAECEARARLDDAARRAFAERITVVTERGASKACVCLPGGTIAIGHGASREDAIRDALAKAGVTT